jgi:hypothetical protein
VTHLVAQCLWGAQDQRRWLSTQFGVRVGRVKEIDSPLPLFLTFSARLCRNRGDQLLHAGALAPRARDIPAVVFAQAKIQHRLLATIHAFVFVRRHFILLCMLLFFFGGEGRLISYCAHAASTYNGLSKLARTCT